jgi:hypothetical protein
VESGISANSSAGNSRAGDRNDDNDQLLGGGDGAAGQGGEEDEDTERNRFERLFFIIYCIYTFLGSSFSSLFFLFSP